MRDGSAIVRVVHGAAVAGIYSLNGVTITNAESVQKSYPAFFEDLKKLTGDEKLRTEN